MLYGNYIGFPMLLLNATPLLVCSSPFCVSRLEYRAFNLSSFTVTTAIKSFRHRLYEKALKFYWRLLHLPASRWSHLALVEHMRGGWDSKYMSYIFRIREEVGMLILPSSLSLVSVEEGYLSAQGRGYSVLSSTSGASVNRKATNARNEGCSHLNAVCGEGDIPVS